MHLRYYVPFILLVALNAVAQGQTITPQKRVETAPNPATKTDIWLHLASAYIDRSPTDSAQYALNQGFKLVEEAPYTVGEYFLLSYQTELLDKNVLFAEGFQFALKALRKAQAIGDPELLGDSYTLLGLLYNDSGQPTPAIQYLQKSLTLLPRQSRQKHSVSQRYHALLNLGQCYLKLRQYKPAIDYLNQGLHEAESQRDYRVMAICSRLIGDALYEQYAYEAAKQHYRIGLQYARFIQDWDAATLFYPKLFVIYHHQRLYRRAHAMLREGTRLIAQTPDRIAALPRKSFYAELIPVYQLLGNVQKVIQTQQTMLTITETINRQNSGRQLRLLQELYSQENDLLRLTAERTREQIRLRQNNMQNAALIGIIGLLVVVFGISLYSLRQRRKLDQLHQQQQQARWEQQRELAELRAMLAGEEQERNRLAHELHNGIGGLLVSARYSLERLCQNTAMVHGSEPLTLVDEAYQEVRQMAHNLLPHTLQHDGLVPALAQYCQTVACSTQLQVNFQAYGLTHRLETVLELWLYRIGQELVSNILKHADAHTVLVQLSYADNWIYLTVEDDGRGFCVAEALRRTGMGLCQLHERVGCMGGTVQIDSKAGWGTSIVVELPVSMPGDVNRVVSDELTSILQAI